MIDNLEEVVKKEKEVYLIYFLSIISYIFIAEMNVQLLVYLENVGLPTQQILESQIRSQKVRNRRKSVW